MLWNGNSQSSEFSIFSIEYSSIHSLIQRILKCPSLEKSPVKVSYPLPPPPPPKKIQDAFKLPDEELHEEHDRSATLRHLKKVDREVSDEDVRNCHNSICADLELRESYFQCR